MLAVTSNWCKFKARVFWFLFPRLRYQVVQGIGRICHPTEVTVIVAIPPEKPKPLGQEPLSLDMIEDPIDELLESKGLGYLDGNEIDLETGRTEIWFILRRPTLKKGILAIQAKIQAMALPDKTTLRVLDYETTEIGMAME